MNHKLYEEWLFTYLESDDLEDEQSALLQDHLRNCKGCQELASSWREMDQQLFHAVLVSPRTGFSDRWQARFEKENQFLQRRQTMAALVFAFGGVIVLFGSLLLLAWPWLGMPEVFVWGWVYRMMAMFSYYEPANSILSAFVQISSGKISPFWWILFAGLLSEMVVLWLVSYRWLTNPRRIMIDETTK